MRLRVDRDRLEKLALELGKAARATARDYVFVHEGPRVYMAERTSVQVAGTCRTCKHWDMPASGSLPYDWSTARCAGLYEVINIFWEHGVETPPDFGCNKWEERKS